MMRLRDLAVAALLLLALAAGPAAADDWADVLARARGQTVTFGVWGGAPRVNAYLDWAAEAVRERYGVILRQETLTDPAAAVARVEADKAAGRDHGGSFDLMGINGRAFAALKGKGLLYGPIAPRLPNYRLVDTEAKPTTVDFTVPVEGMEAPWGLTRFVFLHDAAKLPKPPRSFQGLLAWARKHPGRFTYPSPPNTLGTTFLIQALMALSSDWTSLSQPATVENFDLVTAPLWPYLDALNPLLWRDGTVFPENGLEERGLLSDGSIDIAVAFNALEAASGVESGLLPVSARVFGLEDGTLANANFLAIPYNAGAPDAALVVINFLLSPEAQARKQDPRHWGSATVLDLAKLTPEQRRLFGEGARHAAAPDLDALGPALPEPHPSWPERIEKEWLRRYRQG